jgi:two-component system nitrate/nitrite response regulator NarL
MRTDVGAILIVDQDVRFGTFAARLFERAGFSTIGATTGAEGVAAARSERPGLVLLEVCLPDINGFEVSRQLRDEYGEDLPIVFVSGERRDPLDRAAGLLVGGDDYLVKPCHPDELLARVRRLISRPHNGRISWQRAPRDASLTRRELEVLRLLAEGMRPREIARELVISPKTVSNHVQRVLGKLGARSSAEAVAIAYREGFGNSREGFDKRSSLSVIGGDGGVTAHVSGAPASPTLALPASSANEGDEVI